ncbi:MAG: cobyrinate a,c-diamide synthase, partial [Gordonibacter urolithinfaciens]
FKKGADFIDHGCHTVADGRTSRNLDRYFMEPDQIRAVVRGASAGADVCVVEAAMGLYDGLDAEGSTSSAEIAKITATPVVLVLDVTRMTRTAGALVLGCCAFDPDVRIAGVILNRVRGARQRALVTEVIERTCGIPVVGAVPADARLNVPDRHLGLVTSGETDERERLLDGIADVVAEWVDLDAVRAIAASAGELPAAAGSGLVGDAADAPGARATIAVVRDEAFSFYYPENLAALERAGARLVFVRSLGDEALPSDVDGLYVGGGFPEEFAEQLQANEAFRRSVRERAEHGLPVYAECGGLMYLGRRLVHRGRSYDMAGVLGLDTVVQDRQTAHGYARAVVGASGSWLDPGMVLVGHEHHHSQATDLDPALRFAYAVERGRGIVPGFDGACTGNVVAGYLHVNALASPAWAPSFVRAAERYRARRSAR